MANKSPKVFGDGEQTRDFVFVKDVVRANLLAAHAKDLAQPAIYNVGTGTSVSLNQLLAQLSGLFGRDLKPVYLDPVPGDVKHSRADISKVAQALGYKPQEATRLLKGVASEGAGATLSSEELIRKALQSAARA